MRLITFLILDLIGSLLWIALCVGLGYAIGQRAVDVAHAVSHYALWATIALVVGIIVRQVWLAQRRQPARSSPSPRQTPRRRPRRAAPRCRGRAGTAGRARSATPRCRARRRRSCPTRTGRRAGRRRR